MSTTSRRIILSLPFSRTFATTPYTSNSEMLCQPFNRFSSQSDSAVICINLQYGLLKRKENSSRGLRRRLEVRFSVAAKISKPLKHSNVKLFPFQIGDKIFKPTRGQRKGDAETPPFPIANLLYGYPYFLGSANPWRNTLPMEPFLTSVFRGLI